MRELLPNVGPGKAVVNASNLGENWGMEKYIVTLTVEEREQLEAIVSKGSHQSQKVINALILLNCDTSSGRVRRSGQEVAAVLHVSERKIDRVKKRFVEEGYEAALVRPPSQRVYDSKIDGELEARLIALSCGEQRASRGPGELVAAVIGAACRRTGVRG